MKSWSIHKLKSFRPITTNNYKAYARKCLLTMKAIQKVTRLVRAPDIQRDIRPDMKRGRLLPNRTIGMQQSGMEPKKCYVRFVVNFKRFRPN